MARNGIDMMPVVKKDGGTGAFFGNTPQLGSEMPAAVKYGYLEMREFIEEFEGKVWYAKGVNQEKLKNKVLVDLNRLNREERMVQKLEEKLAKQGVEVNESSMIKKDLVDLQSLEQFSNNLKSSSDTIQKKIESCQTLIANMRAEIAAKKNMIRTTNSRVMDMTAQKELLEKALKKYKRSGIMPISQIEHEDMNDNYLTSVPELPSQSQDLLKFKKMNKPLNNKVMDGTMERDDYSKGKNILPKIVSSQHIQQDVNLSLEGRGIYLSEVKRVREINEEIRQYFLKKSNGFIEMRRLISDCFAQQRKRIVKMHKMSSNLGLADSMIFDIGAQDDSVKKQFLQMQKKSSSLSQTRLQDRELRNVLYDTIKHIKAAKIDKEEQLLAHQYGNLTYAQFKEFTPDQIHSLLMVKPQYLTSLLSIFDLKEKAMNLMIVKAKFLFNQRTSSTLNTSQSQHKISTFRDNQPEY